MVTTRRARPDLTDSWADVDDDNDADYLSSQNNSQIYNEEDERREMADEYRSRLLRESRSSAKGSNGDVTPRRRNLRSSVEPPELVMPASPDGDGEDRRAAKAREAKQRASTPHFRLNERSLTSDAGSMHYIPPRSSGPRSRMNTRSMTSDAGRSRGSRLQEQDEDDEENERHQPTDAVAKTTAVLWQRIAQPLLGYTGSVMGLAVHNAKPILGWLLLFYALAAAFVFASNFVTNSFHNALSPEHINKITDRALNPPKAENEDAKPKLEPLPESATTSTISSQGDDLDKWYKSGLELIAANQVGVVLMAGGQGTRLGSSAPKGCYDIGLPSKKSLFQLQAERILKLQHLAAKKHGKEEVVIPWYIMTSGPTRKPTEQFFDDNKYFGLNRNNVIFFEQGVLPCITMDGKILLETKSKVAVAPDGNGGLYQALISSGVVQDLRERGVKHIHAYCVDNCLVRVADPIFIGFSAEKNVDIATKVVRKRNAKESVGLILQKNGKPDVVEYSEIDSETAEATDSKDSSLLKFRAANIVNHYYSYSFLESIPEWMDKLPHHIAKKKIPHVDEKGNAVKPEKPNGIKLEQFVFDCFPFLSMDKFACMEVKREDEFSPLKNARGTGEDDPDTSRKDILQQGKRFLQAAGATVTGEGPEEGVEVSPLISYGGEGLEFLKGREVVAPAVIEKED